MRKAPLSLPRMTLVAVDTAAHDLTRLALADTLRKIEPAETLVFSDRPIALDFPHQYVPCQLHSVDEAVRFRLYQVPGFIRTTHYLTIEWDSWVLNEEAWDPAWLKLDYIGAVWPWMPAHIQVGNSGFSLRSTRLAKAFADSWEVLPHITRTPEDVTLCQQYRRHLEAEGFRWATPEQAEAFAFERGAAVGSPFGFHGIFNWQKVLTQKAYAYRMKATNDYVRSKPEWKEISKPRSLIYA